MKRPKQPAAPRANSAPAVKKGKALAKSAPARSAAVKASAKALPKAPAAKPAAAKRAPGAKAHTKTSAKAAVQPSEANSLTGPRNASDDAVTRATGRDWREWFALLDAAGAADLDHKGIAAAAALHGAGAWWQQMVAVEYEQARGLRKKHERPTGFEVSRSLTVLRPVERAYAAWADDSKRQTWLREPLTVRTATPDKSLRFTWSDGRSSLEVYFWRKGPKKTQVTVQHARLPDARSAERMKEYWGEALERFEASVR